jgi:hypothetical protein
VCVCVPLAARGISHVVACTGSDFVVWSNVTLFHAGSLAAAIEIRDQQQPQRQFGLSAVVPAYYVCELQCE